MKPLRVALYERVSTDKQEFRAQHHALLGYCTRQGWKSPATYEERDSRANARRTVLNRLLVDARAGLVDVVVVYKIDRLGSRALHVYQVVEEFRHLKVRFISLNDSIDTDDTSGKTDLLLGIMTAISGQELAMIRERTKAGIAAARKRGVRVGRPPIAPKRVALVQFLKKQKKTGIQIARATGLSEASVSRILSAKKKGKA